MTQGEDDPTFPDRLQRLLDERGWNQSDLARALWGETNDGRAYMVPKNRQLVSRWLSGKISPTEQSKRMMASALGVSYSDLFPFGKPPHERPGSGVTLHQVDNRNSKLTLEITIPTALALQIIELIQPYT